MSWLSKVLNIDINLDPHHEVQKTLTAAFVEDIEAAINNGLRRLGVEGATSVVNELFIAECEKLGLIGAMGPSAPVEASQPVPEVVAENPPVPALETPPDTSAPTVESPSSAISIEQPETSPTDPPLEPIPAPEAVAPPTPEPAPGLTL